MVSSSIRPEFSLSNKLDTGEGRCDGLFSASFKLKLGQYNWGLQVEKLLHGLAVVAASVWTGGLWAIGYLAVPVLFHVLPENRMLAGKLAGEIFGAMAYAGMACALYLLGYAAWRWGRKLLQSGIFWTITAMLLLTLLGHFGFQPLMAQLKADALPLDVMRSVYAAHFSMLHGAASLVYLLQSLLGIMLLLKIYAVRPVT